MKFVEFFGDRNIGKSYIYEGVIDSLNYDTSNNYSSVFYLWLLKKKKISFLKYNLIKYLTLKEISDNKKNNLKYFIYRKLYFYFIKEFIQIKNLYLKPKIKNKYRFFFQNLFKILKNNQDLKKLEKWILDILIGYELSNKMNVKIISSEGIVQRIYSLYLRTKISKKQLLYLIKLLPKPTHIIYILKSKKNKVLLSEIAKIYELLDVNLITIYNKNHLYKKNINKIVEIFND